MGFVITVIGDPSMAVGGEVMTTPLSTFGPWILLFVAVATVVAVPLLTRRVMNKFRRP